MATNGAGKAPRAVIHKRILESAESEPDASLEALAGEIPGASPDLVERVLEEYGDPGEPASVAGTPEEESEMSEPVTPPTAAELTAKQRETLEAIAAAPEATQSDLAETLGVSRATVNKRLGEIEGFDWPDREAFVQAVLSGEGSSGSPESTVESAASTEPTRGTEAAVDGGQLLDPDAEAAVEQLQERIARLERQQGPSTGDEGVLGDTELLAKVLRAVMADDDITEDEEVAVLEALR